MLRLEGKNGPCQPTEQLLALLCVILLYFLSRLLVKRKKPVFNGFIFRPGALRIFEHSCTKAPRIGLHVSQQQRLS